MFFSNVSEMYSTKNAYRMQSRKKLFKNISFDSQVKKKANSTIIEAIFVLFHAFALLGVKAFKIQTKSVFFTCFRDVF